MQVIPAIDLLGGKAVRLHQGRYDEATVYDDDPEARARSLAASSSALHVVDLDGARDGRATQADVVARIASAFATVRGARGGDEALVGLQIGGGIRTEESAEAYLALGASRVVLGTAAVRDRALVEGLATRHPGRVVLAVDARDGLVALDGWTETSRVTAVELAASFAKLPLAAVLYTDIARDGTGAGPNVEATARLAREAGVRVIASGGIGSLEHLRALARAGIFAAIVGRAIYDRRFTLEEAIEAARGSEADGDA